MTGLKNITLLLVGILMVGCIWGGQAKSPMIDKNSAWDMVKKEVLQDKLENKIVYLADHLLKANEEIKSWGNVQKVPPQYQQAWLFFVDEQPQANWGHNCLYIFVDVDSGAFTTIKSQSPPDTIEGMTQIHPLSPTP